MMPIPVKLRVSELQCQSKMRVANNNPEIDITVQTKVVPFPMREFEEKMAFWDAKYGETNPPPYPVTSVDFREGDVKLDDLYDTDSISLSEITDMFNDL
jgi:hypothetical protein